MKKRHGIVLQATGDIFPQLLTGEDGKIVNGMAIGDTLYQNQYLILTAQKGDFKELPLWGAALGEMTNDNDIAEWRRTIREELSRDGLNVRSISVENNNLTINAEYA